MNFPRVLGFLLFFAANLIHAETQSFSVSNNVVSTGTTFTFSQFNPTLGTLSAIDLIINSSTPGGSITVTNLAGTPMDVDGVEGRFRLTANATLGLTAYTSTYIAMNTTPGVPFTLAGSASQAFSIAGDQSLIGGSPVTRSISSTAFAEYLGLGTVTFLTNIQANIDTLGESYNVNSSAFNSSTSMTLRYTYTPAAPVPIPEPGQVAASLLLLGGIGAYVFLKRRKKAATPAA